MADGRVLVIDKEVRIRNLIRLKLARAGYDVVSAAGWREGLESAQQSMPDLIVTHFFVHTGPYAVEFLQALRKTDPSREVPIILLTGSVLVTHRLEADLADIPKITLMEKPFSPRKLLRLVHRLLDEAA
jgi:two-component system chemotaxis response regulator CheY